MLSPQDILQFVMCVARGLPLVTMVVCIARYIPIVFYGRRGGSILLTTASEQVALPT